MKGYCTGNPDFESTRKHLSELSHGPVKTIGRIRSTEGIDQPLMYDYPLLHILPDTKMFAHSVLDANMSKYFQLKGHVLYKPGSIEFSSFISEFHQKIRSYLPLGVNMAPSIGTPIVVERYGDSEPGRVVNVIFALSKDLKSKDAYLWAHPIQFHKDGSYERTIQTRQDTLEFSPPLWAIQKEFPFGYRGKFPHVVSYPAIMK